MSNFFKRVLILKNAKDESPAAILKVERTFDGCNIELKNNFSNTTCDLELDILCGENFQMFKVSDKLQTSLDLSQDFSAGIFSNDELLSYGSTSGAGKHKFLNARKNQKRLYESVEATSNYDEKIYDDEQIATVNYYDNRLISEDIDVFKEQDHRNAEAERGNQTEEIKKPESAQTPLDEATSVAFKEQENASNFFQSIKNHVIDIFSHGARESCLENVVPSSRWVKVNYSSTNSYVFGIVEKDGCPKYICYGVPGKYGEVPQNLENASFIPSSLFDLSGFGYFVMFQNASTGERIAPNIDAFGL